MRYLSEASLPTAKLYFVRGFLDVTLCRKLTDEMLRGRTRPATISDVGGADITDQRRRRTNQVAISTDEQRNVEQRFASLAAVLEEHFKVKLAGMQTPQFLRYCRGDFYRAHQDSSTD